MKILEIKRHLNKPDESYLCDLLKRGNDYVKSLHAIMSYNKLNDADLAYLWDKGKIVVSPAP